MVDVSIRNSHTQGCDHWFYYSVVLVFMLNPSCPEPFHGMQVCSTMEFIIHLWKEPDVTKQL